MTDRLTDISGIIFFKIVFLHLWIGTCVTVFNGSWQVTHNLINPRWGHSSFATSEGVLLMGGNDTQSRRTTELARPDNTTIAKFNLKYDTRYNLYTDTLYLELLWCGLGMF